MLVAKISKIKAASKTSFKVVVRQGIARINDTLRNVKSAWIKDYEVEVDENGNIFEHKVLMKVPFILD